MEILKTQHPKGTWDLFEERHDIELGIERLNLSTDEAKERFVAEARVAWSCTIHAVAFSKLAILGSHAYAKLDNLMKTLETFLPDEPNATLGTEGSRVREAYMVKTIVPTNRHSPEDARIRAERYVQQGWRHVMAAQELAQQGALRNRYNHNQFVALMNAAEDVIELPKEM